MAKQAAKKSHAKIKREVDEILAKGNVRSAEDMRRYHTGHAGSCGTSACLAQAEREEQVVYQPRREPHTRRVRAGTQHHATRLSSEDTRVLQSDNFGRLLVRGPAVHAVELPIGAEGEYGPITEHTPDWSRRAYQKIHDNIRLEGARESGHDIEGHVRLNGKRYSAFTSGGPEDFVIVVRDYP